MRILSIAHNTFRETIRDRILQVIIGLCILVIVASRAIAEISLGQNLKIVMDFSLGAIDLFGVVLCIFVGTGLIHKEIDKRTLYTVLVRPINRWEFIVGKYLGMCCTLAVSVLLMGSVFCGYYLLLGGTFHKNILGAVFLLLVGLMFLNAFAVFFSSMASPTVSAISTATIFIVGRGSYELKFLAERFYHTEPTFSKFVMTLYYLLPNFNNFNIKLNATHSLSVNPSIYYYAVIYGLLYSVLMLSVASVVFNKRNL